MVDLVFQDQPQVSPAQFGAANGFWYSQFHFSQFDGRERFMKQSYNLHFSPMPDKISYQSALHVAGIRVVRGQCGEMKPGAQKDQGLPRASQPTSTIRIGHLDDSSGWPTRRGIGRRWLAGCAPAHPRYPENLLPSDVPSVTGDGLAKCRKCFRALRLKFDHHGHLSA